MHGFLVTTSYWIHEFFTTIALIGAGGLIVSHMYIKKELRQIIALVGGLITTGGAVYVLKNIFQVPRPVDAYILETGYAMPSGHASFSFFLATFLIYYIIKQPDNRFTEFLSCIILGATAVMISASRVFLNVHTLSQVSLGALLGAGIAFVAILYTRRNKL